MKNLERTSLKIATELNEIRRWYQKFDMCLKECAVKDGDMYEFGCWSGKSLKAMYLAINNQGTKFKNVHGFDSFEGLPDETSGLFKDAQWSKGNFNSQKWFKCTDNEKIKESIIKSSGFDTINFIEGWYENTLNKETYDKNEFNPAMIVHIDVDLHSSCLEVLDFLFKFKIIVKGTILAYDDFSVIPSFDSGEDLYGEKLAHLEMCLKYKAEYEVLGHFENYGVIKILDYEGSP
mgnify:CR=1 FL=1